MQRRFNAEKRDNRGSGLTPGVEVYCRYIRRNGRVIYPKNAKCFHFFVKA